MVDKISFLPAHTNMTVEEALIVSGRDDLDDVIVIGYDKDGEFVLNSSHISRQEALWLVKRAELHILDIK